jgi:hypothetical protein
MREGEKRNEKTGWETLRKTKGFADGKEERGRIAGDGREFADKLVSYRP